MIKPQLDADEVVVTSFRANRTQGWRAVGGKVFLTTTHLRFQPHAVDSGTGGRAWSASKTQVVGVDVAPRSAADGPMSGGLRRRLRLTLADGSSELFVVNGVEAKAEELRRAIELR